jgi:hypothetical protein
VQELRPELYFVVTATTRAMRRGEHEGVDYLFVSKEEFEQVAVPDMALSSRSADRLSLLRSLRMGCGRWVWAGKDGLADWLYLGFNMLPWMNKTPLSMTR